MKTLSQIAFDFAVDTAQPLQPTAPAANDELPVNVGVRIKALKPSTVEPVKEVEVAVKLAKVKEQAKNKIKSTRGRKSIKQTEAEADLINIPEDEELFKKQYYSIGEVAEMFRVNHSLLRYWENEFDVIQPRKNRKGDRHFRPVDIKNLHLIYHLLRQRKYTIEGAKDFLKKNKKAEERFMAIQKLQQVKGFLLELKANL
ncbi:MAG: MerR family transcriptional regulator [Bacteroidetes bacterium]|nr:MerR family transcriptional regulator [Bacteroidota bacterium]MBS1973004.1 MerR family transcriptional regulator [Bacteroidota bacterium]